jgi:hypothetical protein
MAVSLVCYLPSPDAVSQPLLQVLPQALHVLYPPPTTLVAPRLRGMYVVCSEHIAPPC